MLCTLAYFTFLVHMLDLKFFFGCSCTCFDYFVSWCKCLAYFFFLVYMLAYFIILLHMLCMQDSKPRVVPEYFLVWPQYQIQPKEVEKGSREVQKANTC